MLPHDQYVHYALNKSVKNQLIKARRLHSSDTKIIKAQSGFEQLHVTPSDKSTKQRRKGQLPNKPLIARQSLADKCLNNGRMPTDVSTMAPP